MRRAILLVLIMVCLGCQSETAKNYRGQTREQIRADVAMRHEVKKRLETKLETYGVDVSESATWSSNPKPGEYSTGGRADVGGKSYTYIADFRESKGEFVIVEFMFWETKP